MTFPIFLTVNKTSPGRGGSRITRIFNASDDIESSSDESYVSEANEKVCYSHYIEVSLHFPVIIMQRRSPKRPSIARRSTGRRQGVKENRIVTSLDIPDAASPKIWTETITHLVSYYQWKIHFDLFWASFRTC